MAMYEITFGARANRNREISLYPHSNKRGIIYSVDTAYDLLLDSIRRNIPAIMLSGSLSLAESLEEECEDGVVDIKRVGFESYEVCAKKYKDMITLTISCPIKNRKLLEQISKSEIGERIRLAEKLSFPRAIEEVIREVGFVEKAILFPKNI